MNQNTAQKKRILYVEFSPDIGGAITNVLYPMVTGLDRDLYEPLALFYWPNPYRERFEVIGIKTIVFEKPREWEHPAPVAQLQKSGLVNTLRRGSRTRTLYHGLGSYVQLCYYIPQILRLTKLMKANNVDLVHINKDPAMHGREVVLAAKMAGLPVLCYAQNFSEFQAVDRQIARLIDRYVFCSNAIGKHCTTRGGAIPDKGLTIYPGVVDADKWSSSYDTSQVRRELGWSDKDFVVGNIGRLVRWKGQDVFLKALAEVKREVPNIKGLVVGGPHKLAEGQNEQRLDPFYEELLALAESLDLKDNVHFTGFCDDIPRIMASIDILVHSSSEPEPFATVVIEGMMAARPVIATNAGGMPEMIDDGTSGLLIPLDDPYAMAQAILFYYQNPALAKEMARTGQQKAITQLTARRHINEFQALYPTLIGS